MKFASVLDVVLEVVDTLGQWPLIDESEKISSILKFSAFKIVDSPSNCVAFRDHHCGKRDKKMSVDRICSLRKNSRLYAVRSNSRIGIASSTLP